MKFFYKIIYNPLINCVLRNINKLLAFIPVKLPPSGIIKIKLHDNITIKFKTNQSSFVGYQIFWYGIYNYEYTEIFEKIIKKIRVFVDIGSNSGVYSIMAAKLSENIKILAFDPTNAANYYLNENIRINDLSNKILSYQYALSDKTEMLDFFEVKNRKYPFLKYNLGGASSLINQPDNYNRISVQAFSFDNFIQVHSYEDLIIDLIKIDAEGAEPQIIKGMISTIKKSYPIIICEILMDEVGEEIERLFFDLGYKFFLHDNLHLVSVNKIQKNEKDDTVYNYFLVPPSKLNLLEEFII